MQEIVYSSNFSSIFKAILTSKIHNQSILRNKSENTNTLFSREILDVDKFSSKKVYYNYCKKFGKIGWLSSPDFSELKCQVNLIYRHNSSEKYRLIEKIINESLENDLSFVLNKASLNSSKFYTFQKSVTADIHANKGFCRLNPLDELWLIGEINTEHHTGDIILNFFRKRFPTNKIALFDRKKQQTYLSDLTETYIISTDIFQKNFDQLSDQDIYSQYWQTYYETQYIPEKKNIKLALKNFPKKRWRNMFEANFLKEKLAEEK